jgi:hypothetical protein
MQEINNLNIKLMMKKLIKSILFTTFFIAISSCTGKNHYADDIIHLDVSKAYPVKIISLEDVADIKYVQMEVHDDYLFMPSTIKMMHVSSSTIMIHDYYSTHDFLFFTGDGKPKSKFNHFGLGPEEYSYVTSSIYDVDKDELFVLSDNKMSVYSSTGKHYYSIDLPAENSFVLRKSSIALYDKESLLIYYENNAYNKNFVRISRKDASVIEEIDVPNHKDIMLYARSQSGMRVNVRGAPTHNIVKYKDGFLLTDHSLDTVFFYGRNNELSPVLVRTPSIFDMDPYVFINSFVEAGNYLFLNRVTVNIDMPTDYLIINKKDHSVYMPKILMKDYKGKEINLSPENINSTAHSGTGFIELSIEELKEAYEDNKLSGKLKEMVKSSDDESNNIYMILKFK